MVKVIEMSIKSIGHIVSERLSKLKGKRAQDTRVF
jgi:hypothetical protein